MSKLSVTIIARDNEKEIVKCLQSVKGADEIIVIDTGSIDKTPQVATAHRAKVYYHRWADDFAEARNRALDYVTCPWVLTLDTDEELMGGIEALQKLITDQFMRKGFGIPVIDGEKEFYGLRVFRKSGAYYQGRIHEELNIHADFYTDEIWIKHTPSKNHEKNPERNIKILREVLEKTPTSTRDMYYLGVELYNRGDYDAALYWLEYFTQATARTKNWSCEVYYLISECYCKLHRANKGIEALMRSIEVNPEFELGYKRLAELTKNEKWTILAKKATNENLLFYRIGKPILKRSNGIGLKTDILTKVH